MFVERFDALMNIAELSNSQLGREALPRGTASAEAPRVSARDVRLSGSAPTLRE